MDGNAVTVPLLSTMGRIPKVGEIVRLPDGLGEPSGLIGMWTGEKNLAGNYIITNVHPVEYPFHTETR